MNFMTRNGSPEQERPAYRSLQISTRSRASAIALAIAIIALGGVFLVFGLVLLVSLAAVGTVLGAGLMAYHRLTGRWPRFLRQSAAPRRTLDPTREVFPEDTTGSTRSHPNDSQLPPR